LFGASMPMAKFLLTDTSPWWLAGLFYLGSGLGLTLLRGVRRSDAVRLTWREWGWLIGAISLGGVVAPVLLMFGLTRVPASSASLLLNAEGVFTALLAWFAFRENFDRRIALGMLAIVAGAVVLSWPERAQLAMAWPALAILGACFCWGMDNNLTRKVALADAGWIAAIKGSVAGGVNVALAYAMDIPWPTPATIGLALLVGWLAYGVSLSLFVVALRHLGTARTGAYFSLAPFFGATLAIPLLGEPVSPRLSVAGALMLWGVWLHLTEHHEHEHRHEAMEHEHEHEHDEHHRHDHDGPLPTGPHSHRHRHEAMTHSHAHFPDAHHRHDHSPAD